MARKYGIDPEAYKRRLEREKTPAFKGKMKLWEAYLAKQPEFSTEKEALEFAVAKTKQGQSLTICLAPKELGGKWVVTPDADPAMMLGWSMIYDADKLHDLVDDSDIDHIEEI